MFGSTLSVRKVGPVVAARYEVVNPDGVVYFVSTKRDSAEAWIAGYKHAVGT